MTANGAEDTAERGAGPQASGPSRCLIVDNSRVIRVVARKILESLGFAVDEAEDGAAAVAHCERTMPYAILSEWTLPNMSGLEFLQAVRRLEGGDETIFLFCSKEHAYNLMVEAVSAGADEFIMKPFDSEILESKLAQAGAL